MTLGRSSCNSEMVMVDDRVSPAEDPSPGVKINVAGSSGIHIGPKFVSVTQNVDKTKGVKDLPCHLYIWNLLKSTTRAERICCFTALIVLAVCLILIGYFTAVAKSVTEDPEPPYGWYIDKEKWLAIMRNYTEKNDEFNPLRLVIIAHTVSRECHNFRDCAAEMRNLQNYHLNTFGWDIPFNFLIGNDDRVYEGRGWNIVGAHTSGYNVCSMGLAFVGDYRVGLPAFTRVTELQQKRAHMLFEEGVRLGYLHPNFLVVGAKDLQATFSPGTNLYNAIRTWAHYDHDNVYYNRTCEEVRDIFEKQNDTSSTTVLNTSADLT